MFCLKDARLYSCAEGVLCAEERLLSQVWLRMPWPPWSRRPSLVKWLPWEIPWTASSWVHHILLCQSSLRRSQIMGPRDQIELQLVILCPPTSYCFVFNWHLNDVKGGTLRICSLDSSWFILIHLDSSWFILILFEQLPIRYICRSSGQALFNRIINQLQPLVETFLEADATYQMVPWRRDGDRWRGVKMHRCDICAFEITWTYGSFMMFNSCLSNSYISHEKVWRCLKYSKASCFNFPGFDSSHHEVEPQETSIIAQAKGLLRSYSDKALRTHDAQENFHMRKLETSGN